MPTQGFLAAFNSMRLLIDKLAEAGVLKKKRIIAEFDFQPHCLNNR